MPWKPKMQCIMIPGLKTGVKNDVLIGVVEGDPSLKTIVGKARNGTVQPKATVLGVGSWSRYSWFVLFLSSVFLYPTSILVGALKMPFAVLLLQDHSIAETVLMA